MLLLCHFYPQATQRSPVLYVFGSSALPIGMGMHALHFTYCIQGCMTNGALIGTMIGMFYRTLPTAFRWARGGVACIMMCTYTLILFDLCSMYHATDDYNVASSHM